MVYEWSGNVQRSCRSLRGALAVHRTVGVVTPSSIPSLDVLACFGFVHVYSPKGTRTSLCWLQRILIRDTNLF
jgi:hypothetical protein